MEYKGQNTVQNLIDDRKARLNLIQADSTASEIFGTIQGGEFLLAPLRKADPEAVKDNQETDRLMKEWAWFNIDLPYCIENEIPF